MKRKVELDNGTVLIIRERNIENTYNVEWVQDGELLDGGNFTKDVIDGYEDKWDTFIEDYFFIV